VSIDLSNKKIQERRNALKIVLSCGLLGASGAMLAHKKSGVIADLLPVQDDSSETPTVMFVTKSGQTERNDVITSSLVREWADKNGVSYWRLSSDHDVFQLPEYLRKMHEAGCDDVEWSGKPAMVTIDRSGRGRTWIVPESPSRCVAQLGDIFHA
jgi:hypothetical protein